MSLKIDHLLLASFKLGPTLVEQWKFYFASQLIRCLGLNYIRTDLARGGVDRFFRCALPHS